jgi:hypothetical protein
MVVSLPGGASEEEGCKAEQILKSERVNKQRLRLCLTYRKGGGEMAMSESMNVIKFPRNSTKMMVLMAGIAEPSLPERVQNLCRGTLGRTVPGSHRKIIERPGRHIG